MCNQNLGTSFLHGFLQQRFIVLFVTMILGAILISCTKFPEPKDDDESHASFAREVIPLLLGRRPYGVDEVEVVADIAELHGRDTAIHMLMNDEAYIDHWADVLVDLLQIQREISGGIAVAQDDSCWGEPTRDQADSSIAEWVRDHAPGDMGVPTPAWNMTDLLHSAIALDDLSPLYRANLFTMSMRRRGSNNGKREEIATHFLQTYINRDVACLRCHNPTYSASNKLDGGGNIVWRRTWTIPGHPEKALFGNYLDAIAANSRLHYVMRGDIRQRSSSGMGIRPWGMSNECVTDTSSSFASNNGTLTHTGFKTAGSSNYPEAGFGSLDGNVNPKVSVWELEASLRQGVIDLQDGYQRLPSSDPLLPADEQLYCDVTQVFSSNCTGCHSGNSPSANMNLAASDLGSVLINQATQGSNSTLTNRVVPNNTAQSELYRRVTSGSNPPRMPPGGGGLPATDIQTIEDWINNGATTIDSANCTTSTVPDVHPDEALAFLTASNLVDGIWMATTGYRLTIDNGFPRNRQQRDALRNLTEFTFLTKDWSLKAVLKKILASKWMARRAPAISQANKAYELPLMLDPWVEADPSLVPNPPAHEKANGQGEMVNRYRVNSILRNIASALNWKEPRRFPGGGYPSPLDQGLGQYFSPGQPGFNGINFQSLLALEDEVGLCQKSGHALANDDWINALVEDVTNFNNANPATPLSIGDVWSTLKDRLIQDPTIEHVLPSALASDGSAKSEEQAVVDLFNEGLVGTLTLQSSATELSSTNLNTKLREACGVLVKTPEFLLTNITPRGYSDNNMPDPPRINVCMDGEPCGYTASCGKWRSLLNKMGKFTACEDRSVRKFKPFIFPLPLDLAFIDVNSRFEAICPNTICGFVETTRVNPCLLRPELCDKMVAIPPIDPDLSNTIGQVPTDLHESGFLLMKASGALVIKTQGARYRPLGKPRWLPLQAKTILHTGDQIYLPLTASLHIKTKDLEFGVDPLEQEEIEGVRAQLISITGNDAINVLDRYTKKGALSVSAMIKAEQSGTFETRGIKPEDWRRIISYAPKPESLYTPTPQEVAKMNANFNALHQGMGYPEPEPDQDVDSVDDDGGHGNVDVQVTDTGFAGDLWLILLLVIMAFLFVMFLRRNNSK